MNKNYKLMCLVILTSIQIGNSQNPNWSVNPSSFQNTMSVVVSMADECVPSADANDIVAAFDIHGEIRGVTTTNVNNTGFLTVYSNGSGEEIFFKVYDAGTDKVYNIYNTKVVFIGDRLIGSLSEPFVLNFDSDPSGADAGMDQEVFNQSSTTLEATGMGSWSIVEGDGGSFVDATNPTTVFNGVIGTKYILAWTLTDDANCIGETDEVVIYLVLNQPENNTGTCGDGLDNDGDGLYDCEDPDCGKPVINGANITDPTPIDCSTTQADGTLEILHTNGTSFSIDEGATIGMTTQFTGLIAQNYPLWVKNDNTGCTTTGSANLANNSDPITEVTNMEVMGPEIICMGVKDVNYSLNAMPAQTTLSWSYTGQDVQMTDGNMMTELDFGDNATAGDLIATLSSSCSTKSDTLAIQFAVPFLCMFSNCPSVVNISTGVLQSLNSPQVYRAGMTLESNAEVSNYNYEFSAGESLEFKPGFSVMEGLNFMADIKGCNQ